MSKIFKTATIFIKPFTDGNSEIGIHLCSFLQKNGVNPIIAQSPKGYFKDTPKIEGVETVDAYKVPEDDNLVIVLGGDGTFLSAVRYIHGKSCPITGVNLGNLGFLTETEAVNVTEHIGAILKGEEIEEKRPYFLVSVERKGKVFIEDRPIMNDAIIQRNSDEKMVSFSVQVGGKQVTNNTRGDGLIIATPTGSTAYNLSANGPIVYPLLDALILSPICPSKLSFKPIVIPPEELRITLETNIGHLSLDGRRNMVLEQGDVVTIKKSPHSLCLLHNNKRNFFDLIRTKLGWDL
ncbi:MAG: NAD+ kinase [Alphaproteobacteria bacterium]|jgi:NAD+ kinase